MRKFFYLVALLATAFTFSMCNNNCNIPVESNWQVEYICTDGTEIVPPAEHNATLAFLKDSKIAGNTGCNRFFGNFSTEERKLKMENIGSTRMMCPDMNFENAYLQAISNTVSYEINNTRLVLKDINGNITAVLNEIEPVTTEN